MVGRILLFGSALIAGNGALASEAPVSVDIESHGADLVEVTLTNVTDGSLSILSWGTPFESVISHDIFDIHAADDLTQTQLGYKGRSVKRGDPLPEDFIALAAGESIQQYLSLSVYYAIPVHGAYTLEYDGSIIFRTPEKPMTHQSGVEIDGQVKKQVAENHIQSALLSSDSITVELTPPPETRAARVPAYFSCSVNQQSELVLALQATEEITNVARNDLASLVGDARLNSPRYRNWFGEYSSERFQTVLNTFNSASNVLANERIEFDCRCDEAGLYAYVFPSDPYRIYPCPNFWAATLTGTDSRAGTVLHELTHFPSINGTDDFEYGKTSVALLASTNPDQAVNNADSYEYFAENTPGLAISNFLVFTDMSVGVSEASDLRAGESSFYKVTGANYVQLTSVSGDADLYVYDTAANLNVVCQSTALGSAVDRCELNSAVTVYIEVRGYQDSQFSVVAQSNNPVVPEPEPEPEDPVVVTPEGGDGTTTGGSSGESSGGGIAGMSFLLLLASRRFRREVAPGGDVR